MTNVITNTVSVGAGYLSFLATNGANLSVSESTGVSIGLIVTLITVVYFLTKKFTNMENNIKQLGHSVNEIKTTLSNRPCVNPEIKKIIGCPVNLKDDKDEE